MELLFPQFYTIFFFSYFQVIASYRGHFNCDTLYEFSLALCLPNNRFDKQRGKRDKMQTFAQLLSVISAVCRCWFEWLRTCCIERGFQLCWARMNLESLFNMPVSFARSYLEKGKKQTFGSTLSTVYIEGKLNSASFDAFRDGGNFREFRCGQFHLFYFLFQNVMNVVLFFFRFQFFV